MKNNLLFVVIIFLFVWESGCGSWVEEGRNFKVCDLSEVWMAAAISIWLLAPRRWDRRVQAQFIGFEFVSVLGLSWKREM